MPVFAAIDLKSFYASVECVERGLDPLTACLVVADPKRTEKTICLAVTPALKRYGMCNRPPCTVTLWSCDTAPWKISSCQSVLALPKRAAASESAP